MFGNSREKLKKELERIIKERDNGKISAEELLEPNRKRDSVITKLKRRKIWFTREEETSLGLLEMNVKIDEIFEGIFSLPFIVVKWLKNLVVKNNE